MAATIGLDHAAAVAKVQAMRMPMPASTYHELRRKEREAKEQAEAERRRKEDGAEFAKVHAAMAMTSFSERPQDTPGATVTAATTAIAATSQTPASEHPEKTRLEVVTAARKLRSKMAKATRSKVEADRKDKASAEAFAKRKVDDLERQGRL